MLQATVERTRIHGAHEFLHGHAPRGRVELADFALEPRHLGIGDDAGMDVPVQLTIDECDLGRRCGRGGRKVGVARCWRTRRSNDCRRGRHQFLSDDAPDLGLVEAARSFRRRWGSVRSRALGGFARRLSLQTIQQARRWR